MKHLICNLLLATSLLLSACTSDDPAPMPGETEHTVLMYLPWGSNLLPYFKKNIRDFESVIAKNVLRNERVVVFLSETPTEAVMFELKYSKNGTVRDTLREYRNPAFTTAAGITSILNDMETFAPAKKYAMIIGCHGTGWIPVSSGMTRSGREKFHWEYEGVPQTRFFGGFETENRTDITTLAQGIGNAGLKMEYILFDDCYMSSIETAYDLKEVTHYLIGCPTEIMIEGMPYAEIGSHLIGDINYQGIVDGFLNYYQDYSTSCGTIAVTDCSQLDGLAAVMKEINTEYRFDSSLSDAVQRMDGYSPVLFYDLGDYVAKLCPDEDLLARFNAQLELAVPSRYRKHTEYYYTMILGRMIKINAYSGTTTSDPSTNRYAATKNETGWYRATH